MPGLLDDIASNEDFKKLEPRDQRIVVSKALNKNSDYMQLSPKDRLAILNKAQARFPDAAPSQASSSKPFSPTSGNTLPTRIPSNAGTAQRYAQQGPVTKVEPEPTSFNMKFNAPTSSKPPSITAAPPASKPNLFERGLSAVSAPLSAGANAVKAAIQPFDLAIRNAQPGYESRYPSDIAEQKRVSNLPFGQRMQAVAGQDFRSLAQPHKAQDIENQYQHLPALGKVVSSIGKFGVDLGTDPMTWLLGGTSGAADSMMSKLGDLYQTAKNPVLKQAAKNAVNVIAKYSPVIQKGVSAGFGTQMGVGALQGANKAYNTGDPGAAVTAALQAVMAGLSIAHATGGTDVLNEYLQRQAEKQANAPAQDANAVNALRPPQPEAQPNPIQKPVSTGMPLINAAALQNAGKLGARGTTHTPEVKPPFKLPETKGAEPDATIQKEQVQGTGTNDVRAGEAGQTSTGRGGRKSKSDTEVVQQTAPAREETSQPKEEVTNADKPGLQPTAEVKPGRASTAVAAEPTPSAAGKPVERGTEAASGETKPARTTGIAQRVHDNRDPGEILPGQGVTPEQMVNRGKALIKGGVDPAEHIQMMEKRGAAASGDDIAILRAEHTRLSQLEDRAYDASQQNKLDPGLRKAYEDARDARRDWAKRIKPYSTEGHKIFVAHQGEEDTDTGSFTSIQRAFENTANRPMNPIEQNQATEHADRVKTLETQVTDLQSKLDAAIKQEAETKTAPRIRTQTNQSNRITLPSNPAELRTALADMRAKGGLYSTGKKIVQVTQPGAKSGAVNFGDKPQFLPEVARAIWNHAKTNYIDKGGVEFDDMVNGVASDLGLTRDEVMTAFAQNKYVKDITDEMYRTMSARRDAVNRAKRFIETSSQSGTAKAWNTVTNLPRGIAVFGHGSVGMVTHAGSNIFRPSSWSTYWPNALNQFKYWTDAGFHERAMQAIESDPNYTMWDRHGLKINPDKAYDDYQVYGKYIGAVGRAGNRGMDALKSFRLEYANKIWEGLPDNLKKEPDMSKLVADWVNHATGVGSIGHGQIANVVSEGMFASSLEASRWARLIGDPVKTAKTFTNWKNATPAEQAIAKFRVQRAVELTTVMVGALAANAGLQQATGQKDKVNLLHPTQTDWMKFKWNGTTLDPTGNLLAPVKFLAQLLAEANPNRTPAAYEKGAKRSSLMTDTTAFYVRGKLAPQYGLAADVATGADALGRPLPFSKDKGTTAHPKYTYPEYALNHAPIPLAGLAKEVYDGFRAKGADDSTAKIWVNGLTTLGLEMVGMRQGKTPKPFVPKQDAAAKEEDLFANPAKKRKNSANDWFSIKDDKF